MSTEKEKAFTLFVYKAAQKPTLDLDWANLP